MKRTHLIVALLLLAGLGTATNAQAANLACFVDTPAYDLYRPNACFAVGASSSVAVFKVQNINPNNYDIYWSEPSCTTNSTQCVVSISPGQTKTVTASLVFRPEPEGTFTYTATAVYEFPW